MVSIIKDDKQYYQYLERIEEIFDAQGNTPEADELNLLSLLVEKYEQEMYSPLILEPIEIVKIRMQDLNLKQIDLVPAIGSKGNVSQILNGHRNLTVDQIRRLAPLLKVPVELLIGPPVEIS